MRRAFTLCVGVRHTAFPRRREAGSSLCGELAPQLSGSQSSSLPGCFGWHRVRRATRRRRRRRAAWPACGRRGRRGGVRRTKSCRSRKVRARRHRVRRPAAHLAPERYGWAGSGHSGRTLTVHTQNRARVSSRRLPTDAVPHGKSSSLGGADSRTRYGFRVGVDKAALDCSSRHGQRESHPVPDGTCVVGKNCQEGLRRRAARSCLHPSREKRPPHDTARDRWKRRALAPPGKQLR